MSELNILRDLIGENRSAAKVESIIVPTEIVNEQTSNSLDKFQVDLAALEKLEKDPVFFDLNKFITELYDKSYQKNKRMIEEQTNMSAYDVASSCILNILHKIRNTPVKNYADKWLPLALRSYLGTAVHNFIQENSNQFTEQECSIKVPSIRFSGRIDTMINHNVLGEIKSLPYAEYRKIIKNQTPRINDFYQALTYKYILENHLQEAQQQPLSILRTPPPRLNKYNITHLQYLYVAHDILSADVESLSEAMNLVTHVKKLLNSKHNTFYFISNMIIDLTELNIAPNIDFIKRKIERVNYYLDNNLDPDETDEFVDTNACFFCLFGSVCKFK